MNIAASIPAKPIFLYILQEASHTKLAVQIFRPFTHECKIITKENWPNERKEGRHLIIPITDWMSGSKAIVKGSLSNNNKTFQRFLNYRILINISNLYILQLFSTRLDTYYTDTVMVNKIYMKG